MLIPVSFGGEAEDAAYLTEGGNDAPAGAYAISFTLPAAWFGHAACCACCVPRGPVSDALAAMFRARATSEAPFFGRIVVRASPAGEAAVRDAIETDVLARARYRLG